MQPNDDVSVTLPFSRLMKLLEPQEAVVEMQKHIESLEAVIKKQRREIDGLHSVDAELIRVIGDLRRSLKD